MFKGGGEMNREKFEALPKIKSRLISVKFNERLGRYESINPVIIECFEAALWLNGAYYVFCEQEKMIEKALAFTDDVHSECWQDSINCIREVLK